MKTLLVMRHAKSDWKADFSGDHERPLNRRGVEAAGRMGRRLVELDLVPELVVSSTAVRARTTAALAMEKGGWETKLTLEPGFYGTGPETVLGLTAQVTGVDRLMIVGHQPTWSLVVMGLTGESVEMKTATVAVVDVPIAAWDDLPGASGTLRGLHHP
jgi:phosphohistidine phosphatase